MTGQNNGEQKPLFERLPPTIVPTHYDLTIQPHLDTFKFNGDVQIHLKVCGIPSSRIRSQIFVRLDQGTDKESRSLCYRTGSGQCQSQVGLQGYVFFFQHREIPLWTHGFTIILTGEQKGIVEYDKEGERITVNFEQQLEVCGFLVRRSSYVRILLSERWLWTSLDIRRWDQQSHAWFLP